MLPTIPSTSLDLEPSSPSLQVICVILIFCFSVFLPHMFQSSAVSVESTLKSAWWYNYYTILVYDTIPFLVHNSSIEKLASNNCCRWRKPEWSSRPVYTLWCRRHYWLVRFASHRVLVFRSSWLSADVFFIVFLSLMFLAVLQLHVIQTVVINGFFVCVCCLKAAF